MFTKLRFQSRLKKFWNRWFIKQYAIIFRSRLINTHTRIHYIIISQHFLSIANALHGSLALTLSIKILVCIPSLYLVIFAVPSPRGAFGGLAPQTKLQAPQIELWSTIYRWSFCEISECQAP